MKINFSKMHGAGNDYIYFNCLKGIPFDPIEAAVKLSDRHFGIGGDGIILICNSEIADAKMRMFNNDGSEGKMCGNAIRCVGKYLYDFGIVKKNTVKIETLSGIKTIELSIENGKVVLATVDMGSPILNSSLIPTCFPMDLVVNEKLNVDNKEYRVTCVSMGNPHAVIFTDNVKDLELDKIGPKFENHKMFPDKVNTEFIRVIDRNTLEMRVWERGSGETLACGTGACASVVAATLNNLINKDEEIKVILTGGNLYIKYTNDRVYMKGDCHLVFEGEMLYD